MSVWTPPPGWVGPGAPAAGWGPQPQAVAVPTTGAPRRRRRWRAAEGGGGYVAYGIAAIALPILGFIVWIEVTPRIQRCDGLVAGSVRYAQQDCQNAANAAHLLTTAFGWWLIGGVVAGVWCGLRDGRRRRRLARGQTAFAVVIAVVAVWTFAAYATGYLIGRRLPAKRGPGQEPPTQPPTLTDWLHAQPDIPAAMLALAGRQYGTLGGHIGWDDWGNYLGARPRGGMLVIGPPGSGKTSGVLIPSILVAPGALVSSSIKTDIMQDTAAHRALIGRCWHFDPGGDQRPSPGVQQCRWSPLVSVGGWDDARRIASRMAEPMRHPGGGTGDSAHFVDRARDWLEVLLYTAHLDGRPIGDVADWAGSADQDTTAQTVLTVLLAAADRGDPGARIAQTTLEGLLGTPDRERGSVLSTLARMLRIYGSLSVRQLGHDTNFDPHTFVRSTDTLYLTATPERQHEYAPLIAALLEEIRYAVYGRHRAEDDGREPRRPHVTFALDEANNTAPIPLPAIISEAGGQSLHLVVGIQDLSRARARWGTEADGFLTLFPTKLVFPGVVEPYTLNALSDAAGEYDRQMISYSRNEQFIPASLGQHGTVNIPHRTMNPTYSIQRQRVLHQGDIANLPDGKALLVEGARWSLVNTGLHYQHPLWRYLITAAKHGREATQTMAFVIDSVLFDTTRGAAR